MMEFMKPFTVSFFGHREIDHFSAVADQTEEVIRQLLIQYPYVEFLVGRDGDFDQIVSSAIRCVKRQCGKEGCCHILVLPYLRAEYANNVEEYEAYYDEIEICEESAAVHPKGAIRIRNRFMVDRSDLVICYLEHDHGGAFQTVRYAEKIGKDIINIHCLLENNRSKKEYR